MNKSTSNFYYGFKNAESNGLVDVWMIENHIQ